ncbi:hypothetical protein VOLCADRAFT_61248 [Volvox carteri f. nagariensis]|uniref:Vesicle transport protein n=1 Tax=Volvox carteri f. nagariensis TaxID=3068 RepID=D8TYH1_VOLCA|nr:uncharacterized protein VOLCADRAFT_61248 [Volvox carteri f. nagariensis]EFJ47552.1 hypothetical protein VOLCADRAFT_61248 [Volvox carteri f. nagariensis]|eukprot:XP_002951376.1 hypothetical protein VOLCADRAFT_61248 [Volvox carteri f. nagariensis]
MEGFLKAIGASGVRGPQKTQPSLLADWQDYSSRGSDLEAGGGASTSSTSALFQSAEQAGTKVTSFLSESFKTVQTGVTTGVNSVASGEAFSIPSGQALVYFFSFMAAGAVFLMLAFMLFLPVVILAPSKFALSFTLGCLSIMVGFMQLRGWKQQLQHMMSSERLPYSMGYIGSVLATLYAALIMRSYLLSLLCSGLQVVALLYYLMSYFPGGANGVKFMLGLFYQAALRCFNSVYAMVAK